MKLLTTILTHLMGFFTITPNSFATPVIQEVSGTIEVSHAYIAYKKFYTPTSEHNTPIIFLHGGPGFSHNTMLNLKDLALSNPVIFYDQSGCGDSKTKDSQFSNWTLQYYLDELHELVQALGYKQVSLFGLSWGGMLGAKYSIDHPNMVKQLILASPLISSPQWIIDCKKLAETLSPKLAATMAQHEAADTTNNPDYEQAVHTFYQNFCCRLNPWPKELVDDLGRLNMAIYKTMWGPYEMTATGNLKDIDLAPELFKIKIPTLIICGQYDMAIPESMQKYIELLPQGKLVVLKNCSHFGHLEEPEKYIQAIQTFLASHVQQNMTVSIK